MSVKTIMSVCNAEPSDAEIKAAGSMCESLGAHLSLVVVGVALTPPIGQYAYELSEAWMDERKADLQKISAQVERAKTLLDTYGISYEVDSEYAEAGWTDNAIGLHARYSDLVVLGRSILRDKMAGNPVLEGCLFSSARPVLIVPAGVPMGLRPKKVMIAWNSRLEAARAVYNAIGILGSAESVDIVLVDPVASSNRSGGEPGADIAAYLARHGLDVTVERLASGGRSVPDVLKQHAIDISADLVVMGAYGHSRLRERVFGGVTRAFIDETPVPVFLAH